MANLQMSANNICIFTLFFCVAPEFPFRKEVHRRCSSDFYWIPLKRHIAKTMAKSSMVSTTMASAPAT